MLIRLTELLIDGTGERELYVNAAHIRHASPNETRRATALVVGASHPEVFYVVETPEVINELASQAQSGGYAAMLDRLRDAIPAIVEEWRERERQYVAKLFERGERDLAGSPSVFPPKPRVVVDDDRGVPATPVTPLAGLVGLGADAGAPATGEQLPLTADATLDPPGLSKFERNRTAAVEAPVVDEPTPTA